jgi:hypothetical protein
MSREGGADGGVGVKGLRYGISWKCTLSVAEFNLRVPGIPTANASVL